MERQKVSGVYKILNVVNGKMYIGSTEDFQKRKNCHLSCLRRGKHHCRHLQYAYFKYGPSSFEFSLLEETKDLMQREQHYLDLHKGPNLYNSFARAYSVTGPDHPMFGRTHTQEARAKIREARARQVVSHSPETRAKMSMKSKGRRLSQESIEKMRQTKLSQHRVPWNKGLTVDSDPRVRQYIDKTEKEGRMKELLDQMLAKIKAMELKDKVMALNAVRTALHEASPFREHPIDLVLWEPISGVARNDYNPNSVAPTELKLLETSICEDGYTQPVVTWISETGREIVDGFHRSKVAKESTKVAETLHGFLPVTTVRNRQTDKSNRMAATIRHNRARGKHSVQAMSDIVVELKRRRWSDERIAKNLGMESDEILRLCQVTGIASVFADRPYSEAWEPAESDSPPEASIDESEVLGE